MKVAQHFSAGKMIQKEMSVPLRDDRNARPQSLASEFTSVSNHRSSHPGRSPFFSPNPALRTGLLSSSPSGTSVGWRPCASRDGAPYLHQPRLTALTWSTPFVALRLGVLFCPGYSFYPGCTPDRPPQAEALHLQSAGSLLYRSAWPVQQVAPVWPRQ
jgi:hypothetical protein